MAPDEALLRAEVILGPELAGLAATVADGNLSLEDAQRDAKDARVLSQEQLRSNQAAGQNIDQIRQDIGELTRAVITKLAPYASVVARGIVDHLIPLTERVANAFGGPQSAAELRGQDEAISRQLGRLAAGGTRLDDPVVESLLSQRRRVRERLTNAEGRERVLGAPVGKVLDSSLTLGQGERIVDAIQQSSNALSGRFGAGNNPGLDSFDRGVGGARERFHSILSGGFGNLGISGCWELRHVKAGGVSGLGKLHW